MSVPQSLKRQIIQLYFDPNCPAAFSPVEQFYQYLKSVDIAPKLLKKSQLKKLLTEFVPGLTVNKNQQMRFERRTIAPDGLDQVAFADLMFFRDDILKANRIAGKNKTN